MNNMKQHRTTIIAFLTFLLCVGYTNDLKAQQTAQFEVQYQLEDWIYRIDNRGVWGFEFYNGEFFTTRITNPNFRSFDEYTGNTTATMNVNYQFAMGISGYQDTMYMALTEPSVSGYARFAKLFMPNVVGSTPSVVEITGFPMNSSPVCIAYDTDNDALWANYGTGSLDYNYEGSSSDIYQLDLNGNIINTIPSATHGLTNMTSFAYYNDGTTPYLWITQFDGILNKFDLTTNTVVLRKDMRFLGDSRGLFQGLKGVLVSEDAINPGETTLGLYAFMDEIIYYNIESLEYLNPDAGVSEINLRTYDAVPNNFIFEGTIKNYGEEPLSSATVEVTADGSVIASETFNFTALSQFEEYEFAFSSPYDNSALFNTSAELIVKTTAPNAQPLDDDNLNDGIAITAAFGTDVFPHKKVLLEPCMPDPAASWYNSGWLQMEAVIGYPGYDGDYTVANLHRGGSSVIGIHGIISTYPITSTFSGGWPRLGVDRQRNQWTHYSTFMSIPYGPGAGNDFIPGMDAAKEGYTPFDISIGGERTSDGTSMNVTVDVLVANGAVPDDYRISIYVTEDDVENDGNSRMDNTVRLVFPVENDGFDDLYSWGVENVIPSNPVIGETYSHTFENIAIDPSWKIEDLKIVALVHTHDDVVANDKRGVSNSADEQVSSFGVAGLEDLTNFQLSVFPNPASSNITIKTSESYLIQNIELIDVTGRVVSSFENNQITNSIKLDVSNVASGTYSLKFAVDNQIVVRSVIID